MEIVVDKNWKKNIVDVKSEGDQTITLKFVVKQNTFNIISAYAPYIDLTKNLKENFVGVSPKGQ